MASKLMIVLSAIAVLALLGIVVFLDDSNKRLTETTGLAVSQESFPVYLETHPILQSLPKDASIAIDIGGQAYGVNGRSVSVDTVINDADISITLPKGYEERIGQIGLCAAIREAVVKKEIQIESSASNIELMMKYYKLIKYRDDCLKV